MFLHVIGAIIRQSSQ